eukprot:11572709-Alexandrium_andersonii.AAC.1
MRGRRVHALHQLAWHSLRLVCAAVRRVQPRSEEALAQAAAARWGADASPPSQRRLPFGLPQP